MTDQRWWPVLAALVAIALGAFAVAVVLRGRRYRRSEDEVHRTVSTWWVPAVAVPAAVVAVPFVLGRPWPVLVALGLALVWAVTLAVIDLEVRRLPDVLTLPAYPVLAVLTVLSAAVTQDWTAALRAAACAGIAVAAFLLLALFAPGSEGLGLGDVKLAGTLAALLGWVGWTNALFGLLTGFIVGGLVAVVLLASRRADRRSAMPFGPAMIIGGYVWLLLPT